MRIGRYLHAGSRRLFWHITTPAGGAWLDGHHLHALAPRHMQDALERALCGGDAELLPLLPELETALPANAAAALQAQATSGLPAEILPPVEPRSFICVGLNYLDHARESGAEPPQAPLLFGKTGNALAAHRQPVRLPPDSRQVDYEAELAVIVGRVCRQAGVEQARNAIAGYCCANDISARDFQFGDTQWYRGKSADTFGPLGPVLVTPAEVGDPHDLSIRLRLNGRTLQDSNTSNLIFHVPELIAYISRSITLQPGDVILTGTPPGVGFARKPPIYLQPGDEVEVEIEKLGILANPIVAG